jgi:hypothetical protein
MFSFSATMLTTIFVLAGIKKTPVDTNWKMEKQKNDIAEKNFNFCCTNRENTHKKQFFIHLTWSKSDIHKNWDKIWDFSPRFFRYFSDFFRIFRIFRIFRKLRIDSRPSPVEDELAEIQSGCEIGTALSNTVYVMCLNRIDRNFPCQTLKIRKVSGVVMGS